MIHQGEISLATNVINRLHELVKFLFDPLYFENATNDSDKHSRSQKIIQRDRILSALNSLEFLPTANADSLNHRLSRGPPRKTNNNLENSNTGMGLNANNHGKLNSSKYQRNEFTYVSGAFEAMTQVRGSAFVLTHVSFAN